MKRLLLVGGGHAHVHVLANLAAQPLADWTVRLVTPYRRQIYSGMLPGWIAGHYPLEACAIRLDGLAERCGVALHASTAVGLDVQQRRLQCADGSAEPFDLLSIDTGPEPNLTHIAGAAEHAVALRPIEDFVAAWPRLAQRISEHAAGFDLLVLGSGAAGIEIALAIAWRAQTEGWTGLRISVAGPDELPLAGLPGALRRRVVGVLRERAISWVAQRTATRIEPQEVHFAAGAPLRFDACLVATGAAAPRWPRAAGLATDEAGFIRVRSTLQSVSHPQIYAAGDVAAYQDARPKAGVYAVRAGPVLAANLRAACAQRAPQAWSPQKRALYLISTGNRHALAAWGRWTWGGDWVWRWKDRIDRNFMRRFGTEG